jgi:UDP-N-acetylglucosamine 3-dehydrogenase
MSQKEKIKLGIIGAGKMAGWHLRAYKKIPRVEIIAVCNPDSDKGVKLAKKYNIPNHFRSYMELLACEGLEAVDICVPTGLHKEIIIEALKKNLHIYTEKPMCRSVAEAEEIIALNKKAKKIIFNGFNYRFWPEIIKIKSIIDSGEIGEIRFALFVRTTKDTSGYMFEQNMNAGIVSEMSCHFVDMLCFWGFDNPVRVCSHGTNLGDGRINPDTVSVTLGYSGGMQALIVNSLGIPGIYPEIQVAGTKGSLKLKYGKIILEKKKNYTLTESLIAVFRESMVMPFRILHNPFLGSCRHFIGCILGNQINESDEFLAKKILGTTLLAGNSYEDKKI